MNEEMYVLGSVELAKGLNEKIGILKDHADNVRLKDLLTAALNFTKYGIKKFNDGVGYIESKYDLHDEFMELLRRLQTREITGGAAVNVVEQFFGKCGALQGMWYSRVLLKDLRSGVGVSLANKAGFGIPEFETMLAKDGKECKHLEKIVRNGVWVSKKLDGYRCVAVLNKGDVTLYTRNGKEYENFPQIAEALAKAFPQASIVFDGEIMSNDFSSMQQSAFASTRGTTVGDVAYHVFDCIPLAEWQTEAFKLTADKRYANLTQLSEKFPTCVVKVEHYWCDRLDEIYDYQAKWEKEGYEGAMVLPNIAYFKGRKTNCLMKFKSMKSMDCTVTGVYQGEGKYAGSLGGLHLTQENGRSCDVGSGFTDAERAEIWANPSLVNGRTIEIKYQELSPDEVMRFPVVMRWRDQGKGGKI